MHDLQEWNETTGSIIRCAIAVHRALGPGLLESAYGQAFAIELVKHGHQVEREVPIRVHYAGAVMDCAFRADLVVDGAILVEVKSVETLSDRHRKQVLTYVRLGGYPIGLLFNFNEVQLMDGFARVANTRGPARDPDGPAGPGGSRRGEIGASMKNPSDDGAERDAACA